MTTITFTGADYSGESSSTTFHLPQMDAANHDDVVASTGTIYTALTGITDMLIRSRSLVHTANKITNVPASSDVDSARERKMVVEYEDDFTLELFRIEVPSPDISNLTKKANSDEFVLDDSGALQAFIAEIEANCRTPRGNTLNVTRAYLVGRAL